MSKRIRLFVFPTRPEFLLVYVPEGEPFTLPPVTSPLTKESVKTALGTTMQLTAVSETTPGRWTTAMHQAIQAERGERRQRQREQEAMQAQIMQGAADDIARQRAGLVLHKQGVDDEIRALKSKIGNAKTAAYSKGHYMPGDEFRQLERQLGSLQTESLALQARLGELRKAEKARNVRDAKQNSDAFRAAARELLDPETLGKLYERADEIADTSDDQPP